MKIDDLKNQVSKAARIVGFTGAGISTESGISDYRGSGGIWTKYRVVTLQEFLASEEGRIEYWQRKSAYWDAIRDAEPNAGHLAFVRLHEQGKLTGLITQNIDGLHQKAGLPADKVVELHGNTTLTSCLECGDTISSDEAVARFKDSGPPVCNKCGGWLKPATISFGQPMPVAEMETAAALSANAEIFFAVGSSLAVQPAAHFPLIAKQNGALLVIINRNETALDGYADVILHGETGEILPVLVGE